MTIEEYLNIVAPKIGPNSAFDLMRDARITAFEEMLIEKGIATKEEIDAEVEKKLGETAQNITNMPLLPESPSKKNATTKSSR